MKVEVFKHKARKVHLCAHCTNFIQPGSEIHHAKAFTHIGARPTILKYCGTCIKLPAVKKKIDNLRGAYV